MTDANTLTPCPFCGERAETYFIPERHSYQIECSDVFGCTARVTRDSELGAVEAWNCRAPAPASQPVAVPVGPFPVASKSRGAWDGIEDVLAMPDGTDIYTASQVQTMLAAGLAPGWRAVPVEPTSVQLERVWKFGYDEAADVYRVMLAAAPRNAPLYNPDDVAFPVRRCADGADALPPELTSPVQSGWCDGCSPDNCGGCVTPAAPAPHAQRQARTSAGL